MTSPGKHHVEHVVALMFENRSFDHMLGLLDSDPSKYDGVIAGDPDYSNPSDPANPKSARVTVTDDGTFGLRVDPPHTHASVLEQIGPRHGGRRLMNGFVAAYKRRLAGDRKGRAVVHWGRILLFAIATLGLVTAPLATEWPRQLVLGAAGVLVVLEVIVLDLYLRRRALHVRWFWFFVTPVLVVVVVGGASFLLQRFVPLIYQHRFLVIWGVLCAAAAVMMRVLRSRVQSPPPADPGQEREIMRCMRPGKLPALAKLASSFAVCSRWHCSVPGATWPNRLFAHAGTSDNTVDVEAGLYDNDSIFDRLKEAGRSWHVYRDRDSLAQVAAFARLTDPENLENWYTLEQFLQHVERGQLPAYSFIEPCHDGPRSNSQHPGNNDFDRPPDGDGLTDFERGERLLVSIYEALRSRRDLFNKTVLIITYDEHGGFYDHVPPPEDVVAPTSMRRPNRKSVWPRIVGWFVEQPTSHFKFDMLGPRVPAVVVSPLIPSMVDSTLYEHSAIAATVRKLFAPHTRALSEREAKSSTIEHLWSAGVVRDDLPDCSRIYSARQMVTRTAMSGHAPHREDEFADQIRTLATLLGPKLDAQIPPAERAPRPAVVGWSQESVATLLTIAAERARGEPEHGGVRR